MTRRGLLGRLSVLLTAPIAFSLPKPLAAAVGKVKDAAGRIYRYRWYNASTNEYHEMEAPYQDYRVDKTPKGWSRRIEGEHDGR